MERVFLFLGVQGGFGGLCSSLVDFYQYLVFIFYGFYLIFYLCWERWGFQSREWVCYWCYVVFFFSIIIMWLSRQFYLFLGRDLDGYIVVVLLFLDVQRGVVGQFYFVVGVVVYVVDYFMVFDVFVCRGGGSRGRWEGRKLGFFYTLSVGVQVQGYRYTFFELASYFFFQQFILLLIVRVGVKTYMGGYCSFIGFSKRLGAFQMVIRRKLIK